MRGALEPNSPVFFKLDISSNNNSSTSRRKPIPNIKEEKISMRQMQANLSLPSTHGRKPQQL